MNPQCYRWIVFLLFVLISSTSYAGGKPEITQLNTQFLDNVVNINVHWQSPNPVILLKVLAGKEQQELKIDEYANKRNRRGYSGEATVVLNVEPRQDIYFITYVVYLEDDLNQKSAQRSGKVKVPQPTVVAQPYPYQPSVQVGVQTGVQVGVQVGSPSGDLSGQPAGTTDAPSGLQTGVDLSQPGLQGVGQPGGGTMQTPGDATSKVLSVMDKFDTPPYLHNLKVNRFQGNSVSISTKALDNKGLKEITFRILDAAGNRVQGQTLSNLGKVWQGTSQTFQLPAGKYKAVVQAVDSAGNTSQERSATFELTGTLVPSAPIVSSTPSPPEASTGSSTGSSTDYSTGSSTDYSTGSSTDYSTGSSGDSSAPVSSGN